jgi:hypothetical protein
MIHPAGQWKCEPPQRSQPGQAKEASTLPTTLEKCVPPTTPNQSSPMILRRVMMLEFGLQPVMPPLPMSETG